jgi:hypothetical protein
MSEAPIHIDREGRWFYQGVEIIHRKTYLLFSKSLTRDASGQILVKIGDEQCRVSVEDVPFVVKSLRTKLAEDGGLQSIDLILNDETQEPLRPGTLHIHADNVPYCQVRGGMFEARFSRQAYQHLSPFIEQDRDGDHFFLTIGGQRYDLS